MRGSGFDEAEFFRAIAGRGPRALLIGLAALVQPIGEAEEEETRSLIRWFRRRYSTQAEQLAYAPARHATCSAYSTGLVLAQMAMGAIS